MKRVYLFFGNMLPDFLLNYFTRQLDYAGFDETAEEWAGRMMTLTILLFVIPVLLDVTLTSYGIYLFPVSYCLSCILSLSSLFIVPFLFWLHLKFVVSARVDRAEELFSDFLYNIASNLSGGMVPMQAFLSSAKPEFGILGKEAAKAYEKVASTGMLSIAFRELARRMDSVYIKNFANFFERAVVAGGKLAELLQAYADHFRDIMILKKDLADRTKNFTAFIVIIGALIMPFLMSVAYTYVLSLLSLSKAVSNVGVNTAGIVGALSPNVSVNKDVLFIMMVSYILLSTFITALLIGAVNKGRVIFGFKYVIFLWLIAFTVFLMTSTVLERMLRLV
ncbi:MAG: hypothetical protein D6769_02235 [Methanobacteriota archaeon]|nr:MAG: hypothetical protein D6769_02235 [Euryarchaeota archaeon]